MDDDDLCHLRREIAARLTEGRLCRVVNPDRLVCSPIGVVPKPHSDKRRTIYHLSHPRRPGSRLPSVNAGIHPAFVKIRYESLDLLFDFVRSNPSAHLWKADLQDAFRHVIVSSEDANLMGIEFEGELYQECALAFGGTSSPWLFNLFAEFLHWLAAYAHGLDTSQSPLSHYLDDFFGATTANGPAFLPVSLLAIAARALGFTISEKKTFWDTTSIEILGIQIDSTAQTASISAERRDRIISLCSRLLHRGHATLLEIQQTTGHLQFVTRVVPHGRAFLRRLYDAVKAHHTTPLGRRLNQNTKAELQWWISTLRRWDGVSLLQPSPLVVEHIWTDASKRCIGAHWGLATSPRAVFSHEVARRLRKQDIRFLEALAVLEALRRFSPLWVGPRRVVIHVDNENVRFALLKGSLRDPTTQVLIREIFSLCLKRRIDLYPVRIASKENVLADALSRRRFTSAVGRSPGAAFLLWHGLAGSTRARSSAVCVAFSSFVARSFHGYCPFPATEHLLVEWLADLSAQGKTFNTVKRNLAVLKSWHVDLGYSTTAFDAGQLERAVRGFKRVHGAPDPQAKLSITLPLLRQLLLALPAACSSRSDRATFAAAFCLAFVCFLRAGEITWSTFDPAVSLAVGSVSFAPDRSFAAIRLPASKTDPFQAGVTLLAPAVDDTVCAVAALQAICASRPASSPLFQLSGGRAFDKSTFVAMLRRCLTASGIAAALYAGHSFRRGAATWAARCSATAETIQALGRWRSNCFRRYIDRSPAERAATAADALYRVCSGPLLPAEGAWRDL